jgi:hypothetical protein
MSQGCGCEEDNCPHKTSEVNLWDGTFSNIVVPEGAGLNEVLSLLENYATSEALCNNVNYTLASDSACLGLSAGTYGYKQIIDALVAQICANKAAIASIEGGTLSVDTTDVALDGIVYPVGCPETGLVTSTDLFNLILEKLCEAKTASESVTGDTSKDNLTTADVGAEIDDSKTSVLYSESNAKLEHIAETIRSISDNESYVYEHVAPVYSSTKFTVDINPMKGVVDGYLVLRSISETMSVNPSKDTYFYLSGDSTILRREVANGAPAPAVPSVSHLLYIAVSDGSGVSTLVPQYETEVINPPEVLNDTISTKKIQDDAVTEQKLADVGTATTVGYDSLFYIATNAKGQVTSLTSSLNLSGLTDGQILVYNSGLGRFENADNIISPTALTVPVGDGAGTAFVDSSISISGGFTYVKDDGVEIALTGFEEDNPSATLNLSAAGTFLPPRVTVAEAAGYALVDGSMIYVTDTDATFTSVGFWGVEAGVWVKL